MRNIGRRGRGPGEFIGSTHISITSDGLLVVADPRASRLQVFDTTGRFVRSVNAGAYMTLGGSANGIYVRTPADSTTLFVIDSLGAVVDSVPLPSNADEGAYLTFPARNPGQTSRRELIPYADQTVWTWSPLKHLIVGRTRNYRLEWKSGDTLIALSREVTPVPIPPSQRETMLQNMVNALREYHPGQQIPPFDIPAVKPAFLKIDSGLDGRIWITVLEESVPSAIPNPRPGIPYAPNWKEYRSFEIYEHDGALVGRVPHPDPDVGTRVHVMRGDTVWAQSRNRDGVAIVVRYYIQWDD
jgi:hypothetical protein